MNHWTNSEWFFNTKISCAIVAVILVLSLLVVYCCKQEAKIYHELTGKTITTRQVFFIGSQLRIEPNDIKGYGPVVMTEMEREYWELFKESQQYHMIFGDGR